MIDKLKILAVITARGGSKGLPGKNIKEINGKPLIEWTINTALQTIEIDKTIVSTDDLVIAEIAKQAGASVPFLRPKYLAKDNSSSVDVLLHAINHFERKNEKYDLILLLEPTSPLRKKEDLSLAIKKFYTNQEDFDGIVSLGEIKLENPVITKIIKDSYVAPFIEYKSILQRQQYPKVFFPYGVIYAVKTDILKMNKTIYNKRTMPYLIERWQNYEIDDNYDFMCVEQILRLKEKEIL